MAKRQKAASPEPGELRDLVVGALDVAFPDVQVLDRDLEIGGGRCADLVAIDGEGHLLLVVLARDDDGTLLAAVDALAFARRNRPALLSHLDSPQVRAERPPVVVIVGESLSEPLLARLASIDRESLACLELRTVSSERGRQAYLVPIELGGSRSAPAGPRDVAAFVRRLEPDLRPLIELLVRRLGRIDEGLALEVVDTGLEWRLAGTLIAGLVGEGRRLEGRVNPLGPASPLRTDEDAGPFLERVLTHYVDVLGVLPANGHSREREVRLEDDDGLADSPRAASDLLAAPAPNPLDPSAQILTAEELEAFRQG